MSANNILLLGAIAGGTIFLGLPIARMKNVSLRLKAFLNATAAGVLVFLLFDVLEHGVEGVEDGLKDALAGSATWGYFATVSTIFVVGWAIGYMSLVYYDRLRAQRTSTRFGPGAASVAEMESNANPMAHARRLAMSIAIGIGLHNFAEGLAIGQSAAKGEMALAVILVIGFGLHNATEGFGIVAPLAGQTERVPWGFLALTGLIAGGPTFLGTIIGQSFTNDFLFLGFLSLAAGSILYVIFELANVGRRMGFRVLAAWGVLFGIFLGFGTEFVLVAAGG